MKLNKECIRDMLLYIEEHCIYYEDTRFGKSLHEVSLKELTEVDELSQYSYDDKYYTLQKLFEGQYIQGRIIPDNNPYDFDLAYIKALSLKGHNLLDNIRPEPVWEKTKGTLKKVGDFSLHIMSQVAGETMAAYAKSMMEIN